MSLLVFAQTSLACEPTVQQLEEMAQRDRDIEEKYLAKLALEAEHIFVGMVESVRDSNSEEYGQIADIKIERVLKGTSKSKVSALMYKLNHTEEDTEEEIYYCGKPYDPTEDEAYTVVGERALFYISKGVLLRVNPFPIEPQLLRFNVNGEIQFIESKVN